MFSNHFGTAMTRDTNFCGIPVGTYLYENMFSVSKISRYGAVHTSMRFDFSYAEECQGFFGKNKIEAPDTECGKKHDNIDSLHRRPDVKTLLSGGNAYDLSPRHALENLQGLILGEDLTRQKKTDLTFSPHLYPPCLIAAGKMNSPLK